MHPRNTYSLKGTKSSNIDNVTLYEASRALYAAAKAGDLYDGAHIHCEGRPVVFWCCWMNQLRPMFKAHQDERKAIRQDSITLAAGF
tara:strand:- start:1084 stop:1344 length:261 start_codon:yes stop_codon:yes gene_type:complete